MRKKLFMILVLAAAALCAPLATPVLAQEAGAAAVAPEAGHGDLGLPLVGATLGLGLAAGLCGIGQGKAIVAACEGIARNPNASGPIRMAMLLGLAFIESLVIYMLVIAWIKV